MDILHLFLSLFLGFVIGYIHTGVAIAMLFRPYEEIRLLGLRFQGMIPRRRSEIARSVSRIVSSDLLKEERVAQRIGGEDVRHAFEALALDLAARFLEREYGSLREGLGEARARVAERLVARVLGEGVRAAGRWAATAQGVKVIEVAIEFLLDRTTAELLPGEEVFLSRLLVAKGLEGLASPRLEERTSAALRGLVDRLASTEKSLGALLPPEVFQVFHRTLRESVPSVLGRFEDALLAPENVGKIKGAIRAGIRTYLLETSGGVVRNLARQLALLGRDRIFREVDEVVEANLFRLRELVYEEENRAHLEAGMAEALDAFFQRTPQEVLASLSPGVSERLSAAAARWLCERARRPDVEEMLAGAFGRELQRVFQTPLRDFFRNSEAGPAPVARWARAIGQWASQGGLQALLERGESTLSAALLDAPVGRPARFLPDGLVREILGRALDQLMPLVSSKVPEILRIVDVEGLIEKEVLHLPPQEVERVIVSVAKKELGAIAWWGGVLGALVGGAQILFQRISFGSLF